MAHFFKKFRKKFLVENRISRYLLYAIGEIVLVVLGILIAIQINDWNRDKNLYQEELESYNLIISDLKRDSILFHNYKITYDSFLDGYFKINKVSQNQGTFENVFPDFIAMNAEFNPVTQDNHQKNIDKLRNNEIRVSINKYFRRINQVKHAREEFNELITKESRPFFLVEQNILKNDVVFNYENRTFPPLLRVSTIDTAKFKESLKQSKAISLLSELRMSMGFYLAALDFAIIENQELITELENRIHNH
ncbi:DUF6090 family protein [Croceivirga thetidis]|uniref:CHASE3 domain-containing protein n=1 Tax=Croceivirga thetidis TaxID=2721623 RepID=A0ABX1GQS4_9FLAO|nr:DUF6090 family protein [Croceivirga thetidis]NKI32287.1 hypothetical protein [Croceivirga thetidis]